MQRAEAAIRDRGIELPITFVRSFHDHPMYVDWVAERLRATLATLDDAARARTTVLFTAHSLPVRVLADGTQRCKTCDCDPSCRYRDGLQETADLVAKEVGLEDHRIAWQSVGRTADPWWGPGIDEMIPALAAEGRTACVVCCVGFVADHLETLYDLDIEATAEAADRRARVRAHADAERRPGLLRSARRGRARAPRGGARMKLDHLERELGPPAAGAAARAVGTARARRRVPAGDQGRGRRVPDDGGRRRPATRCATLGQRAYNGVAILSRVGLEDMGPGSRAIPCPSNPAWSPRVPVELDVVCVYVVNGKEVGDPAYETKLAWLEALRAWLDATRDPAEAADRRRRFQHRARRPRRLGSGAVGAARTSPATPNGSACAR